MKTWKRALCDSLVTGSAASVATTATIALCGARELKNAIAPINAVSHILWGDNAAQQDSTSVKYTLSGLALNAAACFSWTIIYEKLCGESAEENPSAALAGGALVSLLAYVVDYHVVPKRLTPGLEKRLSCKSLIAIYAVLALSMSIVSMARKDS